MVLLKYSVNYTEIAGSEWNLVADCYCSWNPLLPFWCLIHKWLLGSSSCRAECRRARARQRVPRADTQPEGRNSPQEVFNYSSAVIHSFSLPSNLFLNLKSGTVGRLCKLVYQERLYGCRPATEVPAHRTRGIPAGSARASRSTSPASLTSQSLPLSSLCVGGC